MMEICFKTIVEGIAAIASVVAIAVTIWSVHSIKNTDAKLRLREERKLVLDELSTFMGDLICESTYGYFEKRKYQEQNTTDIIFYIKRLQNKAKYLLDKKDSKALEEKVTNPIFEFLEIASNCENSTEYANSLMERKKYDKESKVKNDGLEFITKTLKEKYLDVGNL